MKLIPLIFLALISLQSLAQDYSLDAMYGEISLTSNELDSPYTLEIVAGGSIDASELGNGCIGNIAEAPDLQVTYTGSVSPLHFAVESDADTSLAINLPDGNWSCDDDGWEGLKPLISLNDPDEGVYDIWVGTYDSGEFESSTIIIGNNISNFSDGLLSSNGSDVSDESSSAFGSGYAGQTENGQLDSSDSQYDDGSYQDVYNFPGNTGDSVIIDLASEEFDSYLVVRSPRGEEFINDDFNGDLNRSLLSLILEESGSYQVIVTSFSVGETGSYSLGIEYGNTSSADITQELRGELINGDDLRNGDKYIDSFSFAGVVGQTVNIDLRSESFDTFLILESPGGSIQENDDADSTSHSVIETELSESGSYTVYVTSYGASETGSYVLNLSLPETTTVGSSVSRDTVNLVMGDIVEASLDTIDAESSDGQYQDFYSITGQQGQFVSVTMRSSAIDTLLKIVLPDGSELENDDFEGSQDLSKIEFRLPQDGRYSVIATSYRVNETGTYQILASVSDGSLISSNETSSEGEVYGIFVGISDYSELRRIEPGWGDLPYTDDDAIVARNALLNSGRMREANAITLTNLDATTENVSQAFSSLSQRIGPEDTFVFFYSGHGGQVPRLAGPNAADADGYDETLALANGIISDDEVSNLFDSVDARVSLIILDSCYSGGFAKDIVSRPGRMGLFSSDEDVPSLVAAKFQAGGYLSHFFREAVEGDRADRDQDNAIDAMELSQYLHERYSTESLSKGPSSFNTPDFGYQHLIADRGGVPYDAVIFSR